jgi:hypothetical protein
MIQAAIGEPILRRIAFGLADQLVGDRDEDRVKNGVVSRGDGPAKVDLAGRTGGRGDDQRLRLFEEMFRI